MASVLVEQVFLTQPNYFMVGPSPSEIDVPTIKCNNLTVNTSETINGALNVTGATTTNSLAVTAGATANSLIVATSTATNSLAVTAGATANSLIVATSTTTNSLAVTTSTTTNTLTVTGSASIPGVVTTIASVGGGASVISGTSGGTVNLKSFTSNTTVPATLAITNNANTLDFEMAVFTTAGTGLASQIAVDQFGRSAISLASAFYAVSFTQTQTINAAATSTVLANTLSGTPTLTTPSVSGFNTATGIYTVGITGLVMASCSATFTGGSTYVLIVQRNGATVATSSGNAGVAFNVTFARYCTATDTINFQATNNDGGAAHSGVFNATITVLQS